MERNLAYFVSDVHLGDRSPAHRRREAMFVQWLRSIDKERTLALYLLGDIWDFWYEWRDTVPKGYVRVFAALLDLMDAGVKVYFTEGNHDVWSYSYFREMGMEYLPQPAFVEIGGRTFCLSHGDRICFRDSRKYRFMEWLFRNKVTQTLFSVCFHPTVAMAFGRRLISNNHLERPFFRPWKGEREPMVQFARETLSERPVDCFVFGHLHIGVEESLPGGAMLYVLESWRDYAAALVFDTASGLIFRLPRDGEKDPDGDICREVRP